MFFGNGLEETKVKTRLMYTIVGLVGLAVIALLAIPAAVAETMEKDILATWQLILGKTVGGLMCASSVLLATLGGYLLFRSGGRWPVAISISVLVRAPAVMLLIGAVLVGSERTAACGMLMLLAGIVLGGLFESLRSVAYFAKSIFESNHLFHLALILTLLVLSALAVVFLGISAA